jgi:hypothetical protein
VDEKQYFNIDFFFARLGIHQIKNGLFFGAKTMPMAGLEPALRFRENGF